MANDSQSDSIWLQTAYNIESGCGKGCVPSRKWNNELSDIEDAFQKLDMQVIGIWVPDKTRYQEALILILFWYSEG